MLECDDGELIAVTNFQQMTIGCVPEDEGGCPMPGGYAVGCFDEEDGGGDKATAGPTVTALLLVLSLFIPGIM